MAKTCRSISSTKSWFTVGSWFTNKQIDFPSFLTVLNILLFLSFSIINEKLVWLLLKKFVQAYKFLGKV